MDKQLIIRPEAGTATVENLVASVRSGQVRIPSFQRPLRWEAPQVVALFDSIYKGYPIGSLLLQKKRAEAAEVILGPLRIAAPSVHDALWVIDGQQRLTSLAAGLARPTPVPTTPDDPFIVYFDAKTSTFQSPQRNGVVPSTWVPVAQLLDASGLIEWIFSWQHSQEPELRTSVFEAGTRLRQYQVPLYTVVTEEESVLRDIFYRTNTFGKVMAWEDVHKALFSKQGEYPSTLADLSEALAANHQMGQLTQQQLLTSLMAFEGLDPTRNLTEHARRGGEKELEKLQTSVQDALPVIGRVLDFLRNNAEIPHLRLLPRILPFVVLTRYFRLFPQPSNRSLQLLARWTWRVLTGLALFDERTLLRYGVISLQPGNDEVQAQLLLNLIPNELPEQLQYQLPDRFDARATDSRLALCAMFKQNPLRENGQAVELIELGAIIQRGNNYIISTSSLNVGKMPMAFGPANRILFPTETPLLPRLMAADWQQDAIFLTSHVISQAALEALHKRDRETFLSVRGTEIERLVRQQSNRLAAWGEPDRISINQLVAQTEAADLT
ncbi:DUF262 domain-containing protein [Hymenobacter sp. ASUV-10]|uniref:DUF262 domain-containing protein n=1 Tax=Hymenobacter aranciens TaxID=3063996 RepID=A0ABT9BBB3_9BACT|nr:DUF262 domain-containing protein [Hymenobacter sp. ASUV-10]MDO7873838.1 DUF262 domain-containing protein [Hymenobacter sp. ASUV-10]